MKKKIFPLPILIEEGLESYGDIEDEHKLGGDYFVDTSDTCDGSDIFCQDGLCPTCNYKDYLKSEEAHNHCDQASYDCPDPDNCTNKGWR